MKDIFNDTIHVARNKSRKTVDKHFVAVYMVKERINLDASRSKFLSYDENHQGINTFNQLNVRRALTVSWGKMDFAIPVVSILVAYTHCGITIRERSGDIKVVQLTRNPNTGRGHIVMAPYKKHWKSATMEST